MIIIERQHGSYCHRYNPVLIALVCELKRKDLGEIVRKEVRQ
jgi:hypothetical protein